MERENILKTGTFGGQRCNERAVPDEKFNPGTEIPLVPFRRFFPNPACWKRNGRPPPLTADVRFDILSGPGRTAPEGVRRQEENCSRGGSGPGRDVNVDGRQDSASTVHRVCARRSADRGAAGTAYIINVHGRGYGFALRGPAPGRALQAAPYPPSAGNDLGPLLRAPLRPALNKRSGNETGKAISKQIGGPETETGGGTGSSRSSGQPWRLFGQGIGFAAPLFGHRQLALFAGPGILRRFR